MNKYGLTFCLLLLGCLTTASASTLDSTQHRLTHLSQRIKQLQQNLDNSTDKRDTLEKELKMLDERIADLSKKIESSARKMNQKKQQIQALNQENTQLSQRLKKEQSHLARLLNNQYRLGDSPYLQVLLNQQDPNEANRLFNYFRYIYQARRQTIKTVNSLKLETQRKQTRIQAQMAQLERLNKNYQQQKSALNGDSRYQSAIIKKLEQQISSQRQRINNYLTNKKKLEQIVRGLRRTPAINPSLPFSRMRGKLPWPVKGNLSATFGNTRNGISSNGIRITARRGQDIAATYAGKVLFSRWLKGYGLLIIIDHGQGYMSLYAHNQSLYKKSGDSVKQGEVIATVGHSGGLKQNSLYFEIRHNGKPVNPLKWLS